MTLLQGVVLAGVASSISAVLTNGLDMAKLRMQVQRVEASCSGSLGSDSRFGYKNIFHGMYSIVRKEGFLSLFKGNLKAVIL